MSRRLFAHSLNRSQQSTNKNIGLGLVMDIVLDGDSEAMTKIIDAGEDQTDKNFGMVGSAKIRKLSDNTSKTESLRYYQPLDYSFIDLPIKGEIVELIESDNGSVYYKRIIYCLYFKDNYFYLSRNFRLQKVGDLNWLIKNFGFGSTANYVDELMIINVKQNR